MTRQAPVILHTIWVGPAASRDSGVLCGHDTFGLQQMECSGSLSHQPVYYWCLDEMVDYYRDALHHLPTVTVKSIERDLLKKGVDHADPKFAACCREALGLLGVLMGEQRNSVSDRVTIKDFLSIIILYLYGDYVGDTNLHSIDGKPLNLMRSEDFSFPCFERRVSDLCDIDVWLLHAPKESSRSLKIIQSYLEKIRRSERDIFLNEGYSENFINACREGFYRAILQWPEDAQQPNMAGCVPWLCKENPADGSWARIEMLNVEKHYFNTHRLRSTLDQLYVAIAQGRLGHVRILIESGEDINQVAEFEDKDFKIWKSLAPIHAAILYKQYDIFEYLLSKNPDLSSQAIGVIDGVSCEMTALDMACHFGLPGFMLKILSNQAEQASNVRAVRLSQVGHSLLIGRSHGGDKDGASGVLSSEFNDSIAGCIDAVSASALSLKRF